MIEWENGDKDERSANSAENQILIFAVQFHHGLGGKFNAGKGISAPEAGIQHAVEEGNAYPFNCPEIDFSGEVEYLEEAAPRSRR